MSREPAYRQPMNAEKAFRYDTSTVERRDFITDGCYYKLLNVDIKDRHADMLVKSLPTASACTTDTPQRPMTLVLEGELRVREQTASGEAVKVKPPGYSIGGKERFTSR